MLGNTLYSLECQCGYETKVTVGPRYERLPAPKEEVIKAPPRSLTDRLLFRPKQQDRTALRHYQAIAWIPAIDHDCREIVEMKLADAMSSHSHTPLAIHALENAGFLGEVGMELPHPGPRLTCPKCDSTEIQAKKLANMTLGPPGSVRPKGSGVLEGPQRLLKSLKDYRSKKKQN